ncbi:hypothetical protein VC83_05224 [Pseudogymnoascus destructans]|uniref:Uncharacterized protein n=1 Tax=Pseudogymnoascus destructans TaxID=655981 RepID=A0A177A6Y6_9PEZI|nr:uncharacterized protein VC83_05224 [Pseudogymnoascus destructans]OAF57906.2 hypothetical protein VC83_05224 [Pseudogymnoascus destructans]
MSPLRRRSSRIRGSKNTPYKRNEPTLNNLAPIGEQEGTPSRGAAASASNVVEASPQVPNTPTTAGRIKPPREEMHPSKAQQSTKKEDEGIRHGFTDIGARKPEILTTPSKLNINSSSEFEFRFAKPAPSLGPEAQQMMSEIREDARRIKAELAAKREEEIAENGGDILGVLSGRKFAQPKGKAGRYSYVHMAEFKKMDSIAAHPSAFRAQPGRITPVAKTLKRTQSKANLADRDVIPAKQITPLAKTLKRTQSKANLADRDASPAKQTIKLVRPSVCPDNEAPAKRARQMGARDTSFARPSSRDANMQSPSKPSTPTTGRTANFLNSLSTPTQSSLARAVSIKQDGTPQSALRRSPSKIALTPGLVKSATMNNLSSLSRSESTHKFTDKMKSILRRPAAQADNTMPPPPSSIPSLMKSPSRANLRQGIPSAPATPTTKTLAHSKSTKHVNFTPTTTTRNEPHHSPTPLKSNIPRSKSFANLNSVAYPTLPSALKPAARPTEKQPETTITYPQLPSSSTLSRTPLQPIPAVPAVPGIFTFTSGQTIKFGTPPAPPIRNLGTSPGQTSIRQENEAPPIPHGLANKKRARAASPDEVEVTAPEMKRKRVRAAEPGDEEEGGQEERWPKKWRGNVEVGGAETMARKIVKEQMAPKSNIPSSPKRAGGLSLSRLKMLAMPKSRR